MNTGLLNVMTAVAAFVITSLLGLWLIPLLRRLRCCQPISDNAPSWHRKKEGTPTMGGFLFAAGVTAASLAGWCTYRLSAVPDAAASLSLQRMDSAKFFLGLLMALGFGAVGFLDDYLRAVKKHPQGVPDRWKLVLQLLVACGYLAAVWLSGDHMTVFYLPFLGRLHLGVFYYPLSALLIVAAVNAVNLTDGLDGLCSSVTLAAAMGLMLVCRLLGCYSIGMLAAALAGGCLGFLVWNFHPAKVFMGDVGSLFLGGMLAAVAFGAGVPGMLLPVGIVYWAELLSVLIQRGYYRATGKRLFKMTPIHHHFEMNGCSEMKITAIFAAVTALGCVLAVLSVRFM